MLLFFVFALSSFVISANRQSCTLKGSCDASGACVAFQEQLECINNYFPGQCSEQCQNILSQCPNWSKCGCTCGEACGTCTRLPSPTAPPPPQISQSPSNTTNGPHTSKTSVIEIAAIIVGGLALLSGGIAAFYMMRRRSKDNQKKQGGLLTYQT